MKIMHRSMKRGFAVVMTSGLILSGTTLLFAGGASAGSSQIPVGGLTLLTGPLATFGAGCNQGMQAATKEVNDAGGVGGQSLKLVVADSTSDPVDALPAAKKVINLDHVVFQDGLAGPLADATFNLFSKAGIPFFTPGGDVNFDHNTNPLVWRLTPSDNQLGVAMSLYAKTKGYKKIALLFVNNSTSIGLGQVVRSAFLKLGGKVSSSQILEPGLASYQSEVQKALAGKPDAIMIELDNATAATVFSEMYSLNAFKIPVIGTDTTGTLDFAKAIGVKADSKVLVSVEGGTFASPASNVFNTAIKKSAHAAPLGNSNYCYDGIIIGALAMAAEKGTSSNDVQKGIPVVTSAGAHKMLVYSFAQGVAALKKGKAIQYIGASGPFTYNKYHNVFGPFIAVRLGTDGKTYKTILTMTPAQLKVATK